MSMPFATRSHASFHHSCRRAAVGSPAQSKPPKPPPREGTSRIDWASLLRRVFQVDILACAKCGGRIKVLAVIEQPDVVTKILGHLGMPTVPEGIAPARVPPRQLDFEIDAVLTRPPGAVAACSHLVARDHLTQPLICVSTRDLRGHPRPWPAPPPTDRGR